MADPGFPVEGRGPIRWGRGPLTWVLFAENVCKNEKFGPIGGRAPGMPPLDPPMKMLIIHGSGYFAVSHRHGTLD